MDQSEVFREWEQGPKGAVKEKTTLVCRPQALRMNPRGASETPPIQQ